MGRSERCVRVLEQLQQRGVGGPKAAMQGGEAHLGSEIPRCRDVRALQQHERRLGTAGEAKAAQR
jgi:hypothetical protein